MRVETDFNGETVYITDSKIERRLASRYCNAVTDIVRLEKDMTSALVAEVGLVRETVSATDGQSIARYANDLSITLALRSVLIRSMSDLDVTRELIMALTATALADGFVYVVSEQVWAEHSSHAPARV